MASPCCFVIVCLCASIGSCTCSFWLQLLHATNNSCLSLTTIFWKGFPVNYLTAFYAPQWH